MRALQASQSSAKAGTCVAAFLKELRLPLPDPAKCSMGHLFKFIYTSVRDKVPYPYTKQETRMHTHRWLMG
jgi:hypothetical protein